MKNFENLGRNLSRHEQQNIFGSGGEPCLTDADCISPELCINNVCGGASGSCSVTGTCAGLNPTTITCSGVTCKTRWCKNSQGNQGSILVGLVCDGVVTPRCVEDAYCEYGYVDV